MDRRKLVLFSKDGLTKRMHPFLINTVFLQNGERKNAIMCYLWPRKNYKNKLPTRI